jgi:pimeloyl-ACP methyl ester carboxylesterase
MQSKEKPRLLMIHGALGCAEQFRSLIEVLEDEFNIRTGDLSGHGRSGQAASEQIEDYVLETGEWIHSSEAEYLFGYSMGGYLGMLNAAANRHSLRGIMCLGSKLDWHQAQAEKEAGYLNPDKMKEKVPAYAAYLKQLHGEKWEALCRSTAALMQRLGQNAILSREKMREIEIPVLLMRGTEDKMVSLEETRAWAEAAPRGNSEEMEGWQHQIERIPVQDLAARIKKFVEEQSRESRQK